MEDHSVPMPLQCDWQCLDIANKNIPSPGKLEGKRPLPTYYFSEPARSAQLRGLDSVYPSGVDHGNEIGAD